MAGWLRRQLLEPEPPLVAVEVRPRSLGVVRLSRAGGRLRLEAAVSLELPAGALTVSLTQPNLVEPPAFTETLRGALARAGVLGGGPAALVLPDPAVRVALWPAAELAARHRAQTEELVRFKLRKSVPFDLRDARLDVQFRPPRDQALVVAVSLPVLRAYEEACQGVGLRPGLVQPAGLALLGALPGDLGEGDHLLVNWDEGYVTLALSRDRWPVLVRTLAGEAVSTPEAVAREIASTLVYHRERLGAAPPSACLVRAAGRVAEEALATVAASTGITPRLVDPGAAQGLAGAGEAAQAVAGALSILAWVHAR